MGRIDNKADFGSAALLHRLIRGGTPAIIAGLMTAAVPLIGSAYLSTSSYSLWALAGTLSTLLIVLDFGSNSLATKLSSTASLSPRILVLLAAITAVPSVLLGGFAVAVWPIYTKAAQVGVPQETALVTLSMVALGTAMRSIGSLFAAISLGRAHYKRRAAILLSGAVAQLATTYCAIEHLRTPTALGIGMIVSGLIQILAGVLLENPKRMAGDESPLAISQLVWRFVRAKGFATLLSLLLTQLDRWAIGLAASDRFLATYDVVARLVLMPKVALLSIVAGLVAEAARSTDLDAAQRLAFEIKKLSVASAGVVALCCSILLLAGHQLLPEPESFVLISILLTAAHTSHGLTAGLTGILTGLSKPHAELLYLVPASVGAGIAYVLGFKLGSGEVLVIIWALSVTSTSVAFWCSGDRLVRSAHDR
jgi:O-antigen/teichoic acid export membrane protein